jgi:uncharacterized protein YdaU (DUF1376 family)
MSTRLTWYKRYPRDFREGTRKLTLEERGFYGDVLDLIYEHGDQLPDDDAANAHHLHLDARTFRRVKARLLELGKLTVGDGYLRNPRASAEASTAANRIAKARMAGKLGGENSRKSEAKANDSNGSGGADAKADGPAPAKQTTGIREESYTEGKSLPTNTESHTRPEGGAKAVLWAEMKAWLGGKDPGRLIGAWCRDYGEGPVFAAYFKALKATPAEPKSWMVDELKRSTGGKEVTVPKGDQLLLDKFERPKIERQARVEIAATGLDVYTAEGGKAVVARMREIAHARG